MKVDATMGVDTISSANIKEKEDEGIQANDERDGHDSVGTGIVRAIKEKEGNVHPGEW